MIITNNQFVCELFNMHTGMYFLRGGFPLPSRLDGAGGKSYNKMLLYAQETHYMHYM